MRSDEVSFYSGGSRIAAVLNLPDSRDRDMPCVVCAHGYTSYKDEFGGFVTLAELFCAEGFSVLRFDFRGCGESIDINPRGKMLCATEWPEDVYNAAVFASSMACSMPGKIVLLGVSMGGAAVLSAVKHTKDVAAAVAIAPVANGHRFLQDLWTNGRGQPEWDAFCQRVLVERTKRVRHNVDEFVGVETVLAFPEADLEVWQAATAGFPLAATEASFSSVEEILFRLDTPAALEGYDRVPILFVHGTCDTLVACDGTQAMWADYAGPKDLMLLRDRPHGLLLEPDCAVYTSQIVDWVKSKVGAI
jgi:alpha-beta hydrolase superfamily lysophospholipase